MFINLRLILEKVGESSYKAKLEHESKPNPKPVEFNFSPKDQISGDKSFHHYFNERIGELRAREEELEIVGKALYNLVFREDLGAKFQAWYQDLTQGERFRLRLDIQAPELISVPWELLRDDQQFLARRGVSIVRFIGNARKDDVNLDSRMKVLIVSASPQNDSFNEEEYVQPVKALFKEHGINPDLLTGKDATREGLHKILENKYDLFHFVGHGSFEKDQGNVWIINEQGNPDSIRGNDLSDWLWDSGVKFAFFCSCQTGITSQENTFNGVACSLVGRGIPAVVAMQYNFPQEEARTFVESFYNKLIRSESIDEAMRFARNHLPPSEVTWCIPVLYSQFDMGTLVTEDIVPPPTIMIELTFEEIDKLRDALLKCKNIHDDQWKDLVTELHEDIKNHIQFKQEPDTYVWNIIDTCQNYVGGIEQLFSRVIAKEGNTFALHNISECWEKLRPNQWAHIFQKFDQEWIQQNQAYKQTYKKPTPFTSPEDKLRGGVYQNGSESWKSSIKLPSTVIKAKTSSTELGDFSPSCQLKYWDCKREVKTFTGMVEQKNDLCILGIMGPEEADLGSFVEKLESICEEKGVKLHGRIQLRVQSADSLARDILEALSNSANKANRKELSYILEQGRSDIASSSRKSDPLSAVKLAPLSPVELAEKLNSYLGSVVEKDTVVLFLQDFHKFGDSNIGLWLRDEWLLHHAYNLKRLVVVITGENELDVLKDLKGKRAHCFDISTMTWRK